jgi:hypothetical protein
VRAPQRREETEARPGRGPARSPAHSHRPSAHVPTNTLTTLRPQTCLRPARDIFTSMSDLVSAIVVIPLVTAGNKALGGLYFAVDSPCEFVNCQEALLVRLTAGLTAV